MKEMKDLFEEISEEIEGAKNYAKEALRLKDTDPERASMYMDMSKQELGHVDNLHRMAKRIVERYRSEGKEMPHGMETIYNWQHDKMIDCVAKVKYLQGLF